jgi:hypothetical protein
MWPAVIADEAGKSGGDGAGIYSFIFPAGGYGRENNDSTKRK